MSITMKGRLARVAAPLLATGALAVGFAGQAGAQGHAGAGGGKPGGAGSVFAKLSDEQRACLASEGLSRPASRPTAAQWKAVQAAAKECGLVLSRPVTVGVGKEQGQERWKARFQRLSDEQRACLVSKGLQRPSGRPTAEQRQALRAAAAECAIAIGGPSAPRVA